MVLQRLDLAISRVEDPFFCQVEMELNSPITLRLMPKEGRGSSRLVSLTVPISFFSASFEKKPKPSDPLQRTSLIRDHHAAKNKLDKVPLTKQFARVVKDAFDSSSFGLGSHTVVAETVCRWADIPYGLGIPTLQTEHH